MRVKKTSLGAKAIYDTFKGINNKYIGVTLSIVISKVGWVIFLYTIILYVLVSENNPNFSIFYKWIICNAFYLAILEFLSRIAKSIYDLTIMRMFRITCSCILAVTLVIITGSSKSIYWYYFLIPLLTSALYFDWYFTGLVLFLISVIYLLTGYLIDGQIISYPGSVIINISVLFGLTATWKYLLDIIKRYQISEKKAQKLKAIQQIGGIWNSLLSMQDSAEIVDRTLMLIASTTKVILNADVVDAYLYDKNNNEVITPPKSIGGLDKQPLLLPSEFSPNDYIKIIENQSRPIIFPDLKLVKHKYWDWYQSLHPIDPTTNLARSAEICSCIVIPLRMETEFLGMLVSCNKRTLLSGDQQDIFDNAILLMDDFSRLLQNARILERGLIAQRQNEILHEVNEIITPFIDKKAIAENFLINLKSIIQFNKATIQIFRGDNRTLLAYSGFAEKDISPKLLRPLSQDLLIQRVINSKAPVVLPSVIDDNDWESCKETQDVNSWLCYPLFHGEKLIGILTLDHNRSGHFFQSDAARIKLLCDQLSYNLFEKDQSLEYKSRIEDLAMVNQIGQAISASATLELPSIFHLIYEQVSKLVNTDNFYIALYDDGRNIVSFSSVFESGKKQTVGVYPWEPREADNGLTEYVIRTKTPLLINKDVEVWLKENNVKLIGLLPKSWVGVPMIWNGNIIGVISVQDYVIENLYSSDQLQLLTMVASQAAIAIQQSKQSHDVSRENSLLNKVSNIFTIKAITLINSVSLTDLLSSAINLLEEYNLGTHFAIYLIHQENHGLLELKAHYPEDFGNRITKSISGSDQLFLANPLENSEKVSSFDIYGDPTRLEGVLIILRMESNNNTNEVFSRHESTLIHLLTSIVGACIRNFRRDRYFLSKSTN